MTIHHPRNYTLVINGKPEGPFTIDELKAKRVRPTDFVRTEGMDDYKEAHELPELREMFGFRKQVVLPQYFGSFDQRMLASVIDWFIVSTVCVVPAFVLAVFTDGRILRAIVSFSLLIIIPLVYFIYHVVMEASAKQGTYGKQVLKIRVTDMNGERIGLGQAMARNLAKLLCVVTLFTGYLFAFFNKQQQCLHDMVAGTLVVKDRLNY